MKTPTPPPEDSRERRRRQNRESQRRWRERYRQVKHGSTQKPKDTASGVDGALLAATPPILDLHTPPPQSKHSLEPQELNDYFVQHTSWLQDQAVGQPDAHISWPPMDFHFPPRPGSTDCQNDELSRDGSTNAYLSELYKITAPNSPEYASTVSSQMQRPFSHFPSAGACPPTSSSSASDGTVYQQANLSAQYRKTETPSAAEEAIRDVQLLYRTGVKAGFLKRDDKVQGYLAAMKRVYHKVPALMDEDYEGPSGSDVDEWSDGAPSDGDKLALPLHQNNRQTLRIKR